MKRLAVFLLFSITRAAVIDLKQLNLQQILKQHDLGAVDLNQLNLPEILERLNSPSLSAGKAEGGFDIDKVNLVAGIRGMKYVCNQWCPKVNQLVKSGDQSVDYWVTIKWTKKTYNRDNFEEVCSTC